MAHKENNSPIMATNEKSSIENEKSTCTTGINFEIKTSCPEISELDKYSDVNQMSPRIIVHCRGISGNKIKITAEIVSHLLTKILKADPSSLDETARSICNSDRQTSYNSKHSISKNAKKSHSIFPIRFSICKDNYPDIFNRFLEFLKQKSKPLGRREIKRIIDCMAFEMPPSKRLASSSSQEFHQQPVQYSSQESQQLPVEYSSQESQQLPVYYSSQESQQLPVHYSYSSQESHQPPDSCSSKHSIFLHNAETTRIADFSKPADLQLINFPRSNLKQDSNLTTIVDKPLKSNLPLKNDESTKSFLPNFLDYSKENCLAIDQVKANFQHESNNNLKSNSNGKQAGELKLSAAEFKRNEPAPHVPKLPEPTEYNVKNPKSEEIGDILNLILDLVKDLDDIQNFVCGKPSAFVSTNEKLCFIQKDVNGKQVAYIPEEFKKGSYSYIAQNSMHQLYKWKNKLLKTATEPVPQEYLGDSWESSTSKSVHSEGSALDQGYYATNENEQETDALIDNVSAVFACEIGTLKGNELERKEIKDELPEKHSSKIKSSNTYPAKDNSSVNPVPNNKASNNLQVISRCVAMQSNEKSTNVLQLFKQLDSVQSEDKSSDAVQANDKSSDRTQQEDKSPILLQLEDKSVLLLPSEDTPSILFQAANRITILMQSDDGPFILLQSDDKSFKEVHPDATASESFVYEFEMFNVETECKSSNDVQVGDKSSNKRQTEDKSSNGLHPEDKSLDKMQPEDKSSNGMQPEIKHKNLNKELDKIQSEDALPERYSSKGKSCVKYPVKYISKDEKNGEQPNAKSSFELQQVDIPVRMQSNGKSPYRLQQQVESFNKMQPDDKSFDGMQPDDKSFDGMQPDDKSFDGMQHGDKSFDGVQQKYKLSERISELEALKPANKELYEIPPVSVNTGEVPETMEKSHINLLEKLLNRKESTDTILDELVTFNDNNLAQLFNISTDFKYIIRNRSNRNDSDFLEELSAYLPEILLVLQRAVDLRNDINVLLRIMSITKSCAEKLTLNLKNYAATKLNKLLEGCFIIIYNFKDFLDS